MCLSVPFQFFSFSSPHSPHSGPDSLCSITLVLHGVTPCISVEIKQDKTGVKEFSSKGPSSLSVLKFGCRGEVLVHSDPQNMDDMLPLSQSFPTPHRHHCEVESDITTILSPTNPGAALLFSTFEWNAIPNFLPTGFPDLSTGISFISYSSKLFGPGNFCSDWHLLLPRCLQHGEPSQNLAQSPMLKCFLLKFCSDLC